MFGSHRNSGIYRIRDYNEARTQFEDTDPIRGRKEEPLKPLGHRRSVDQYSIRFNPTNEAVECWLYSTPVVVYSKEGTISFLHDTWCSQSTACFIDEVTGYQARIFNYGLVIRLPSGEFNVPIGGLVIKEGLPLNASNTYTHNLVRTETNKVRQMYPEFRQYVRSMLKLRGQDNRFTVEESKRVDVGMDIKDKMVSLRHFDYTKYHEKVDQFMNWVEDTSDTQIDSWYLAMVQMVRSFGQWSYKDHTYFMSDALVNKALDSVLFGVYRNQVFKNTEVPAGVVKRDAYKTYFSSGWERYHNIVR